MNKKLKQIKEQYDVYIITQRENLPFLCLEDIPFDISFMDALQASTKAYFETQINDVNNSVFKKKDLPSEAWVDITFGALAGVTVGFKDRYTGEVASMARFCGSMDSNIIQLWTLMTSPEHEGRGLGKATLALVCALNKGKHMKFITQIDNNALLLYLKLISVSNNLDVLGLGFHHSSKSPSVAISTMIPHKPFELLFMPSSVSRKVNPQSFVCISDIGALESRGLLDELLIIPAVVDNVAQVSAYIREGGFIVNDWLDAENARGRFNIDSPVLVLRQKKEFMNAVVERINAIYPRMSYEASSF